MSGQNSSYIYYNIRIINDVEAEPINYLKVCEFNETRVIPIVTNPREYELAVVRFSIPTSNIPLIIYSEKFKLGLTFNGTEVEATLPPPPNNNDIYGVAFYTYQEIADSFTAAFKDLYDQMFLLEPGLGSIVTNGTSPFVTFDSKSNLYSIFAETGWDTEQPNAPVFSIGSFLARFFQSSFSFIVNQSASSDSFVYQVVIKDNKNNDIPSGSGYDLYRMQQLFPTTGLINSFKNIVFQTDRIPVAGEYITGFSRGADGVLSSSVGTNVTRTIITDFEPLSDLQDNSTLQYFPRGPLRYYALTNTEELRTIDVKVFWEDYEQRLFPIYLSPGDACTIKLQFRKRSEHLLRNHLEGLQE